MFQVFKYLIVFVCVYVCVLYSPFHDVDDDDGDDDDDDERIRFSFWSGVVPGWHAVLLCVLYFEDYLW